MANPLIDIITKGKKSKGNLRAQFYINLLVLTGFILFITWIIFLYPKTFISIKLVLALLFIPGLLLIFFIYKKLVAVSGYVSNIHNNPKYNTVMAVATYFLITVPLGNIIVTVFLFLNYCFAQQDIETIQLTPYQTGQSFSRSTNSNYHHMEVQWDGVKKRINTGSHAVAEGKLITMKVSKGWFGYYIIR